MNVEGSNPFARSIFYLGSPQNPGFLIWFCYKISRRGDTLFASGSFVAASRSRRRLKPVFLRVVLCGNDPWQAELEASGRSYWPRNWLLRKARWPVRTVGAQRGRGTFFAIWNPQDGVDEVLRTSAVGSRPAALSGRNFPSMHPGLARSLVALHSCRFVSVSVSTMSYLTRRLPRLF